MLFNDNHKSKASGPPYYVNVDVNSGESLAIQLFDGNKKIITGPATITMASHQAYPPIPLPVNLPPGHMMQQIVDENGVLKHISIGPNNSNEPMPKNQILIKNGAKLIPLHLNGTTAKSNTSSFKKKLSSPAPQTNNETSYKPNSYTNGLTNDALLNSTSLLNANGLVYPLCCCCCPECVPNNQLNSNSLFLNNELNNYSRPTTNFYNYNSSAKLNGYQATRRSFVNSSSTRNSNANTNGKINKISMNKLNNCINNPNCNLNYTTCSTNYQPKSALLSNTKIYKQYMPQDNYSFNNQKHFYSAPSTYPSTNLSTNQSMNQSINQSINHQQQTTNHLYQTNISSKKYSSYASDTKPSLLTVNHKNRAFTSSSKPNNHHSINPPLLNSSTASNSTNVTINKKDQTDCYSELIRYVNSNHISAFKSHKRIEDTKAHQPNNHQERTSNSVTSSSSPISEHYDFSSEESEHTNYKHTTLLNYPPSNYSNGYSFSNHSSPSNCSNNSVSVSTDCKKLMKIKKQTPQNELRIAGKIEALNRNVIETNNLKIDQQTKIDDDKDDGYEDDFEMKSCDNKSNDEVLLEHDVETVTNELINENIIEEKNETNDQLSEKSEDECDKLAEIIEIIDKNEEFPCGKSDVKILDENSNEIDSINRNLIESIEDKQNENAIDYLQDLNVDELNLNDLDVYEDDLNEDSNEDLNENSNEDLIDNLNDDLKDNLKNISNDLNNNSKEDSLNQNSKSIYSLDQSIKDQKQTKSIKKKSDLNKIIAFSLSYTKLTGNYVKLKWTVLNSSLYSNAKDNQFMVEMIYSKREDKFVNDETGSSKVSRIVYQGLVKNCKIQCLKPLEEYSFRVKVLLNDQQLVSNLLTITTPEQQIQPLITKKRTSKHNLQLNLQQQQILKQQQILIEQKEKELQLKQSQFHHDSTKSASSSLFVIFCAICSLFKDNFAYLLIIFFFISSFSFANFISDLLN